MNNENVLGLINEIFIWKETAEHFCYHEKNYDNLNGALPWARETLIIHGNDKRGKIYDLEELENGKTSDNEWNAGLNEMKTTGKMHRYVGMYWAKKLLCFTKTPEEALSTAFYLYNKYSIDGNDPYSILEIMWSICGTMDQGFAEHEIRGKIRGMNGIKAKEYVKKWSNK